MPYFHGKHKMEANQLITFNFHLGMTYNGILAALPLETRDCHQQKLFAPHTEGQQAQTKEGRHRCRPCHRLHKIIMFCAKG